MIQADTYILYDCYEAQSHEYGDRGRYIHVILS